MSFFDRFKKKEKRDFLPHSWNTYSPLTFSAEDDPTVSACTNAIINTLSVLPIRLYSHTKSGKTLAVNHWLFPILENPAVEETPTIYYQTLLKQLLYTGNAYIYLCRDSKGDVVTTKLVDSRRVRVSRTDDYHKIFTIDGNVYTERDILHIPYMENYNGTIGVSPVDSHRDLIKLHQLLLDYINNYFKNSMGSRLAIEFGDSWGVKPAEIEKMYASVLPYINRFISGSTNAGKPMVSLPDSKISSIDQPSNVQGELSSLLTMVEKEIAQCFNVPYEIIDSSQSKYNSLEQKQIDFLQRAILPLGNHIAESFEKLLSPADKNLFIQYEYSHMLKADFKTTVEYLRTEIQSGFLTINEARSKLGMASVEPEVGDILWQSANLIPATKENVESILAKSKLALDELNNKVDEHSPIGDDNV